MNAGLIIGAGLVLAIMGFGAFAQDKGWKFAWWQWLLLALATAVFLYGVAFLGTSIGEDTAGAGWFMFGIALVITVILGAIVGRTARRA